jgi:POT family proton-dependent oligopeptide transporter
MVFVLVEMWERFMECGGTCHFMADKVLGLALSDRDANLKYGAIQAFVYAFTFIGGIFADKVLGLKNHSFGASVMILGNLIIAFSPLHFSIWELHLQLLEQVSSSQIFLQWLGSFIKWGQS